VIPWHIVAIHVNYLVKIVQILEIVQEYVHMPVKGLVPEIVITVRHWVVAVEVVKAVAAEVVRGIVMTAVMGRAIRRAIIARD
jgi:hypothetical protein